MTSLETYQKIHEYKKPGLSKRKIGMNLGISVSTGSGSKTTFREIKKYISMVNNRYEGGRRPSDTESL